MVYRVYTEKKEEYAAEAASMASELSSVYAVSGIDKIRILNRYDVEGISPELFELAKKTVFSEPVPDVCCDKPDFSGAALVFSVEPLPGQYDQRADSAAQCIQLVSAGDRPVCKAAKVYAIYGTLPADSEAIIKSFVINPVEAREASPEKPETLTEVYDIPTEVAVLDGFTEMDEPAMADFVSQYGLAMDCDDLRMCRDYFKSEGRQPTITEIRMLDTYWSDHCRHTTFNTILSDISFEDKAAEETYKEYLAGRDELSRTKPITLMDMGTLAAKLLKKRGQLKYMDESEEINACTVKIKADIDGENKDMLLLFKNETHNHPTEIEPFGGAATCIGGAIRDPLSGRAYVYSAMRVTGAGNPLTPISETIPGKLPQRKIVTTAAAGYSSYGNQIGLATGQVSEIYHPGYVAKRMEIGAVVGAAFTENVRRECPAPGDIVILLGGRTGRDGCGGATGSSKSHTTESLSTCGAEVQKGNAPEERKLQRLFRNPIASRMIKRCNDFGAGGVSVAVGELADGLKINLDAVPKKYEGLDGTELAISESQERMAVVVAAEDVKAFCDIAEDENLEASVIAEVTEERRLTMSWNDKDIVDISRDFIDCNGAPKNASAVIKAGAKYENTIPSDFEAGITAIADGINTCSQRGLSERFDSTIGAGTVIMPFGGKYQLTPSQAMVNKISLAEGHTNTCSFLAWGFDPYISEKSPYRGAYLAVVHSVCKLIASGAGENEMYLSFQEYFPKLGKSPERWGLPTAAILGAFKAQIGLGIAAIGGKDSMSGSFENIDVPPTLVSFACTSGKLKTVISPEFKDEESVAYLITPQKDENGLPTAESLLAIFELIKGHSGVIKSAYAVGSAGAAEAVMKMSFGNKLGFKFEDSITMDELFSEAIGSFIVEIDDMLAFYPGKEFSVKKLGTVTEDFIISGCGKSIDLEKLLKVYENKLESVYPCNIEHKNNSVKTISSEGITPVRAKGGRNIAAPKLVIPVFPGTNCEYDTARQAALAGAEPEIIVIKNLSRKGIEESIKHISTSIKNAQGIFIPGGFSGGDEPDGSGKFISAFFRNAEVKDAVHDLLKNRDGLMAGVCNGFQALIKLGLVPYGEICDIDDMSPTLTYNTISRHQSRIVRTRISSNLSPWLAETKIGDVYNVPISHGEGRFIATDDMLTKLIAGGQVVTQYVDDNDEATSDVRYCPNNSVCAIEGICSPDGRVIGKMGHSERIDAGLYKNVPGDYDIGLFRSFVKYFK